MGFGGSFGPLSFSLGGSDQNLQIYSNAYVSIDGAPLTNEASLTLEKKGRHQEITTLAAGFAGISLGAPVCEVTIESAIPASDFDVNPDFYLRVGEPREIGVVIAGRQTVFKGFITDATYSHSVNKEAQLHLKMLCRYADFE